MLFPYHRMPCVALDHWSRIFARDFDEWPAWAIEFSVVTLPVERVPVLALCRLGVACRIPADLSCLSWSLPCTNINKAHRVQFSALPFLEF